MKAMALLAGLAFGCLSIGAAEVDVTKPFELTTLRGDHYRNCRILKVTPEGITVSHDSGVSRVSFELLGDEWKTRYHYDPAKAREFQKDEDQRRAQIEEKRKQMIEQYEKLQMKRLTDPPAPESRPLRQFDEALAEQQAIAAASSTASAMVQPGPWFPTVSGSFSQAVQSGTAIVNRDSRTSQTGAIQAYTEVAIPTFTPLGQVYTPANSGGQRVIINGSAVYTNGDGNLYYVTPGFVAPGYYGTGYMGGGYRPVTPVCPPGQTIRPPVPSPGGTVILQQPWGGGVIQFQTGGRR